MGKGKKKRPEMPSLCWLSDNDRPALERLYSRMCPGAQPTNLDGKVIQIGVKNARGEIVMAAVGNWATVACMQLLTDPASSASPKATEALEIVTDALYAIVKDCGQPGHFIGMTILMPKNLEALGRRLDAFGFAGTYSLVFQHVPAREDTPPPQPS